MAKTRRASRKSKGTRKAKKGMSDWNKKVMEVYRQLKKKNPKATLGDAMKAAAKKR